MRFCPESLSDRGSARGCRPVVCDITSLQNRAGDLPHREARPGAGARSEGKFRAGRKHFLPGVPAPLLSYCSQSYTAQQGSFWPHVAG